MITHRSSGNERGTQPCGKRQTKLKSAPTRSDNPSMRWFFLLLLALSGFAFTSVDRSLPRGTDAFSLAMNRTQVDSALAARGVRVLSGGPEHLACIPHEAQVEFEQYAFAPTPHGAGRLWRVTVAYRVPYRKAAFDSLRHALSQALGEPAEEFSPPDSTETHRVTWVDPITSVQLAARWPERPDPNADRMLVTWTDRRLQRLVGAMRQKQRAAR